MDLQKPPILESLTPFTRILFSVLLVITSFAITFLLGMMLAKPLFGTGMMDIMTSLSDFGNPDSLRLLQYFQVIQSFGLFIFPALLAGYFFGNSSPRYLSLNKSPKWPVYLFTLILMLAALPLINWMVSVNDMMKLPDALMELEDWMRDAEAQAAKLTEAFMAMPTMGSFLFNMLMIAVLPAIGEEIMFRGLIQRLLKDWLGNIHIAIFISALLFSAMHMQFYGFLPRMLLGMVFGYLFYWTGSLWIPIFAHFIQNGMVVVVTYLGQQGIIGGDYENFGTSGNAVVILLSLVIYSVILFIIRKRR